MSPTRSEHSAHLQKHYDQLSGGLVLDVRLAPDEEGTLWPVLLIEKDGKTLQVEVSRDPEGNGPGHLFIGEAQS